MLKITQEEISYLGLQRSIEKETKDYHKVQHLMIQASKGKQIHWNNHIEILLWTLRGYIRFGRGFIDHLNGQGYKFGKVEHNSLLFRFNGRFLLVPSLKPAKGILQRMLHAMEYQFPKLEYFSNV